MRQRTRLRAPRCAKYLPAQPAALMPGTTLDTVRLGRFGVVRGRTTRPKSQAVKVKMYLTGVVCVCLRNDL
jgi:hypothetical protein